MTDRTGRPAQPEVRHDRERSRYELVIDGAVVGLADYRVRDDAVVFPHTVIDPKHRGRGLGDVLVRAALEDVRSLSLPVDPQCWFVEQFIRDNEEFRDLVA